MNVSLDLKLVNLISRYLKITEKSKTEKYILVLELQVGIHVVRER